MPAWTTREASRAVAIQSSTFKCVVPYNAVPIGVERAQKVIYVRQNLKAEEVDSSQAIAAIVARMDDLSGD